MAKVLLLGATSAIAAAAAERYARRGDSLHLVGRDPAKLAAVVARCAGAPVTSAVADFLRADPDAIVAEAIAALGGLDIALLAHGDLGDPRGAEVTFAEARHVLDVNLTSAVALLIPIANHLEAQGRGRIGVIGSVAGERGRPRNYTYGAAKAGLRVYLQGLRSRLYRAGVTVTTVRLGPVDTPMTVNHTKNRLFARVDPVAAAIVRAVDRGAREPYVPRFWWAIMAIVRAAPEWLFQRVPALVGR